MQKSLLTGSLTSQQINQFEQDGYLVLPGLFDSDEVEAMKRNFAEMHALGADLAGFDGNHRSLADNDVLKAYPRLMHPHKSNAFAFRYMIDPRVMSILKSLFQDQDPLACQSMFYFKPPGARGQALHQDNFYLRLEPETCMAAWTAVDDADQENGGLYVVPGSHKLPIQCPQKADPAVSFTSDLVEPPDGYEVKNVLLKGGDVLFFNGNLIHGSFPNSSQSRFRRAFICHYASGTTEKASMHYYPMYTHDGQPVILANNEGGGPCGTSIDAEAAVH